MSEFIAILKSLKIPTLNPDELTKRSVQFERATAFHEVGHAVASFRVGRKFRYVTIIPGDDSAGHVRNYRLSSSTTHMNVRQLEWDRFPDWIDRILMISLAGEAAQRKGAPRSVRQFHASGDRENIANWLFATGAAGQEEYLAYCRERLESMFNDRVTWTGLVALVEALLEKKQLTYAESYKAFLEGEERLLKARHGA